MTLALRSSAAKTVRSLAQTGLHPVHTRTTKKMGRLVGLPGEEVWNKIADLVTVNLAVCSPDMYIFWVKIPA
jgi:hypothetical protein